MAAQVGACVAAIFKKLRTVYPTATTAAASEKRESETDERMYAASAA